MAVTQRMPIQINSTTLIITRQARTHLLTTQSISSAWTNLLNKCSSIHRIILILTRKQKWPLISNPPYHFPFSKRHFSADVVPLPELHCPPVQTKTWSMNWKLRNNSRFFKTNLHAYWAAIVVITLSLSKGRRLP